MIEFQGTAASFPLHAENLKQQSKWLSRDGKKSTIGHFLEVIDLIEHGAIWPSLLVPFVTVCILYIQFNSFFFTGFHLVK